LNRDSFNELIENIEDIKSSDIASLESLRKQYPYFQNLHLLLAKAYKHSNSELLKPSLNKAAIYAVDRPYLKKILDENYKFIEVIHSKPVVTPPEEATIIPRPKAPPVQALNPDPVKKEEQPQTLDKTKQVAEEKKEVQKPISKIDEVEQPTKEKIVSTTPNKQDIYNELDESLKKYNDRKKIMQELLAVEQTDASKEPSVKKKTIIKESQIQLIEKFIKNEPQMGKKSLLDNESETGQEDLAKKNLHPSDKFLTETIAQLLVKQKKYSKAIKIYEKLMVKFPKKTTYFAAQIEKINQRGNV
jgi:tetratricopeptide (TPR) repeat protein